MQLCNSYDECLNIVYCNFFHIWRRGCSNYHQKAHFKHTTTPWTVSQKIPLILVVGPHRSLLSPGPLVTFKQSNGNDTLPTIGYCTAQHN